MDNSHERAVRLRSMAEELLPLQDERDFFHTKLSVCERLLRSAIAECSTDNASEAKAQLEELLTCLTAAPPDVMMNQGAPPKTPSGTDKGGSSSSKGKWPD
ncbi:unnamed protein product [Vitrella brassicaformis CCMP3155]|uniref:Tubulin-specific chaperone A n=1 Tax=Vitrella brassicaformis (strain CCMP3155) TaxID=1169540 RepID=A0A0G4F3F0_VITBC|nr:unnamed protein product [Vitrella brassicaformis CCMP3155]|eukprot:CEM06356.1 unnamed protein product [Vitrella brassicaformis CCMP3155]